MESEPRRIGPRAYDKWRSSPLGAITERLEHDVLFALAGRLDGLAVLDVGMGDGTLAIEASSRGAIVSGVDTDPAMLAAAAERARSAGIALHIAGGCAERLPFADASFDVVFAVTVLCFVEENDTAVREMARVLKPGGRLLIGELGRWSLWAASRRLRGWLGAEIWRRARFHTSRDLRFLARWAGLSVTAEQGAVYFPPIAALARLLAPLDPWLGRHTYVGAAFVALAADKPSPS